MTSFVRTSQTDETGPSSIRNWSTRDLQDHSSHVRELEDAECGPCPVARGVSLGDGRLGVVASAFSSSSNEPLFLFLRDWY